MDIKLVMNDYTAVIDDALMEYLQKARCKYTGKLYNAMEYALFPGGKRIRPMALVAACIGAGGDVRRALPYACALEMIHAYSLIHDDLPAMDNSDLRRGKPSCHIAFGEGFAVLAGDSLLNLAFEVMLEACCKDMSVKAVNAARIIADAAGVNGMAGGQAADIYYENTQAGADVVEYIHAHKTAALFEAAAHAGALLGGACERDALRYRAALYKLGLAFQIRDDIDNDIGDSEVLGKPVGNDAANKKNTYISVHGLEKAKEAVNTHVREASGILAELSGADSLITGIAGLIRL